MVSARLPAQDFWWPKVNFLFGALNIFSNAKLVCTKSLIFEKILLCIGILTRWGPIYGGCNPAVSRFSCTTSWVDRHQVYVGGSFHSDEK